MRLEGRNVQSNPLLADMLFGAAQAAGQFIIVHCPEQPDFPCRPAPWSGLHRDPPALPLGNDILDKPPSASREHRIGNFAD